MPRPSTRSLRASLRRPPNPRVRQRSGFLDRDLLAALASVDFASLGDTGYSHLIVIRSSALPALWNRREIFRRRRVRAQNRNSAGRAASIRWYLRCRFCPRRRFTGYLRVTYDRSAWVADPPVLWRARAETGAVPMLFLLLMIPIPAAVMARS